MLSRLAETQLHHEELPCGAALFGFYGFGLRGRGGLGVVVLTDDFLAVGWCDLAASTIPDLALGLLLRELTSIFQSRSVWVA